VAVRREEEGERERWTVSKEGRRKDEKGKGWLWVREKV
jgi:hypothetical protein